MAYRSLHSNDFALKISFKDTNFQMETCAIYFGGVPPGRGSEYINFDFGNFLGSMRSLTISNPGSNSILNPLYALRHSYNPYFGIEPNCERKVRIK